MKLFYIYIVACHYAVVKRKILPDYLTLSITSTTEVMNSVRSKYCISVKDGALRMRL